MADRPQRNPHVGAPYRADEARYIDTPYRRSGRTGLKPPAVSLGLWHNFGDESPLDRQRASCACTAFDRGITHFDLANNYGPPLPRGREELRPHAAPRTSGPRTATS